jgi:hypothetical protein
MFHFLENTARSYSIAYTVYPKYFSTFCILYLRACKRKQDFYFEGVFSETVLVDLYIVLCYKFLVLISALIILHTPGEIKTFICICNT